MNAGPALAPAARCVRRARAWSQWRAVVSSVANSPMRSMRSMLLHRGACARTLCGMQACSRATTPCPPPCPPSPSFALQARARHVDQALRHGRPRACPVPGHAAPQTAEDGRRPRPRQPLTAGAGWRRRATLGTCREHEAEAWGEGQAPEVAGAWRWQGWRMPCASSRHATPSLVCFAGSCALPLWGAACPPTLPLPLPHTHTQPMAECPSQPGHGQAAQHASRPSTGAIAAPGPVPAACCCWRLRSGRGRHGGGAGSAMPGLRSRSAWRL